MSRAHRRFAVAYTFLVALPVMGLLGILKIGKTLTAPLSVDGSWTVQAKEGSLSSATCADPVNDSLVVEQSGRTLEITLDGMKSVGSIDGNTLHASFSSSVPSTSCSRLLSFSGTVDPNNNPRTISGVLSVADCPSCSSVTFKATRQLSSTRGAH